jgi:hypothetical protein
LGHENPTRTFRLTVVEPFFGIEPCGGGNTTQVVYPTGRKIELHLQYRQPAGYSPGFGERHHLHIRQASGWLPVECSAVSCPASLTYRPLALPSRAARARFAIRLRSATLVRRWLVRLRL